MEHLLATRERSQPEHCKANTRTQWTRSINELLTFPEVVLAWVYVVCVQLWWIWTVSRGLLRDEGLRFMNGQEYITFTVLNTLFAVSFVFGFIRARMSPPSLQKGHYVSVAVAFIAILLLQLACHLLYGPISL